MGDAVIPSSTKRENLHSNLQAQTLNLDEEDMAAIAVLNCNDRMVSPEGLAPQRDRYDYSPFGGCTTYSLRKSINALIRVLTARSL